MKNNLKILFLFIVLYSLNANAQSTKVYDFFYEKLECKNPNELIEYLKINKEQKRIFYSSGNNPEDIPLQIINPQIPFLNHFGEGTKVKFPNDTKIYELKGYSGENYIECIHSDKSVQTFYGIPELTGHKGTFRCINPNKTIEYLHITYIHSKNLKVKYASSKNPQWIELKISNIKDPNIVLDFEGILQFDVQFPNAPDKYTIIYPKENQPVKFPEIIVKNPDGSKQRFQWINKE